MCAESADRYTHCAVLLILVALGLAIFGTIRATRSLKPGQRVVAWVVFVLAVIWLCLKLVQLGLLGRGTGSAP
jgi:hypothetical protein